MNKILTLLVIIFIVTGCERIKDEEPKLQNNPLNKGSCLEYGSWVKYKYGKGTQMQKCIRWVDLDE